MNWIAYSKQHAMPIFTKNKPDQRPSSITATDLHEQYLSRVLRHVSCRVTLREDAEDITAEVFAAAFQSWRPLKSDADAYPWLLGIARRKIADYFRRRSRGPATVSVSEGLQVSADAPELNAEHDEGVRKIREIVQSLRDEQRDALILQYVDDLSINEIAVVMRKSPTGVNSLLQRARANIYKAGQEYFLGTEVSK